MKIEFNTYRKVQNFNTTEGKELDEAVALYNKEYNSSYVAEDFEALSEEEQEDLLAIIVGNDLFSLVDEQFYEIEEFDGLQVA